MWNSEGEIGREGGGERRRCFETRAMCVSPHLLLSQPPPLLPCSAETPEQRDAPLRCSDVSFIVKHLPRAADPEAIARQAYAPTQGGWPHEIPQSREADDEASAYIDLMNLNLMSRVGRVSRDPPNLMPGERSSESVGLASSTHPTPSVIIARLGP